MSWEIKRIIDVALVTAGQSPEGKYYNTVGDGMPFFQGKKEFTEKFIGEAKVWTTKITRMAEEGDVLMSVRAPVGPVNYATQKCCIGRGLASIRVTENCDRDFLFLFFKHIENELTGNSGAVFNSINKSQIENISIPIPPLSEQQQIVEKLDAAFEAIDQAKANLEKNIQNAKELFQSKLNEVFENGKLTIDTGEWDQGFVKTKLSNLGTITSSKRIYKSEYVSNGVPFWRTKELKELANGKEISLELFISLDRYKEIKEKFGVPKVGDILLSAVGTIGEILVVNSEQPFYFKDGNIVWFKDFKNVNAFYLKYLLKSFIEKVKNLAHGAAYNALTIEKINEIEVSLPKSLETQQKIVNQLDQLSTQTETLKQKYTLKLQNLEELRKSILEKAFKGELTK